MRDVYSKAACCIVATAAEDINKGLFFDRERWSWTLIKVEATWAYEQTQPRFSLPGMYWCGSKALAAVSTVDTAPLNQRSCVAQERYLCTRVMHFLWELLFWDCHDVLSSEAHPDGIPNLGYTGGESYDVRQLLRLVNTHQIIQITVQSPEKEMGDRRKGSPSLDKVASSDIYRSWHTLRSAYSQYGLTEGPRRLRRSTWRSTGRCRSHERWNGLWALEGINLRRIVLALQQFHLLPQSTVHLETYHLASTELGLSKYKITYSIQPY
jgi:hypothetical protein